MNESRSRSAWLTLIGALLVLVALVVWWRGRESVLDAPPPAAPANDPRPDFAATGPARKPQWHASPSAAAAPATAEEIVAAKLKQFARARRDVMRAMARQKNITVPEAVERFFDAVESGEWMEIKAAFDAINGGEPNAGHTSARLPEVTALWAPIIDAYGVAEQVHIWPAQKLLDMGNAVLGQLRPGMVFLGGTDDGRWIPTLLNETSGGERHIVITQNGLADATYLEYIRFLYGDRFNAVSNEDSQRAFNDYLADAQKRLAHDEQFPDEPKQIRSNEQVSRVDGRTSVSGIVAVMDINERLVRLLMEKNPDLSFALQESFPLKGTYDGAVPLGPIMELRAADPGSFTAERAAESVTYWRGVADQLRASPDDTNGQTPLKSYSKLAVGQANLFAERGFSEPAEQTYRIALGIHPGNTDAVNGLADLLERTGRANDARTLLDQFARDYPKQMADLKKSRARTSITVSTSP